MKFGLNKITSLKCQKDNYCWKYTQTSKLKILNISCGYGLHAKTDLCARIWESLLKNHLRELSY